MEAFEDRLNQAVERFLPRCQQALPQQLEPCPSQPEPLPDAACGERLAALEGALERVGREGGAVMQRQAELEEQCAKGIEALTAALQKVERAACLAEERWMALEAHFASELAAVNRCCTSELEGAQAKFSNKLAELHSRCTSEWEAVKGQCTSRLVALKGQRTDELQAWGAHCTDEVAALEAARCTSRLEALERALASRVNGIEGVEGQLAALLTRFVEHEASMQRELAEVRSNKSQGWAGERGSMCKVSLCALRPGCSPSSLQKPYLSFACSPCKYVL
jgi:hypothetical protein